MKVYLEYVEETLFFYLDELNHDLINFLMKYDLWNDERFNNIMIGGLFYNFVFDFSGNDLIYYYEFINILQKHNYKFYGLWRERLN